MQYESMSIAIRTAAALLGLLAVFQFILLPTHAARFRQKMFDLRRRLFLFMADGNIRPDDPAYVRLRNSMNGLIRTAERITFLRVMIVGALLTKPTQQHRERDDAAIEAIPHEGTRKRISEMRDEMRDLVVKHIIATSPLAMALLLLLFIMVMVAVLWRAMTKAKSGLVRSARRLTMMKLRERIPTDTIGAAEELLEENAAVA